MTCIRSVNEGLFFVSGRPDCWQVRPGDQRRLNRDIFENQPENFKMNYVQ